MKVKLIELICFALFNFLIIGCGNINGPHNLIEPASTYQIAPITNSNSVSNLGYTSSNFQCSGRFTIQPQNYNSLSNSILSDTFQVCPSMNPSDTFDVEVVGITVSSLPICLFPAKQLTSGAGSYIPLLTSTGVPLYQCASPTTDSIGQTGTYFSFSTTISESSGFDAAYIIENDSAGKNAKQMAYCLEVEFSDDINCSSQTISYSVGGF